MKREKRVLIGAIIIGIIIVLVLVSAVYVIAQDNGNLSGELAAASPSKARVDVSGISIPPTVLFVSYPNYTGDLLLLSGVASYFNYSFVAWSVGGFASLPQTPAEISLRVKGGFNGTWGPGPIRMQTAPSVSCGNAGIISLDSFGGIWIGRQGINYTCVVKMLYYYDPGTWSINASVIDDSSNVGYNNSRTFIVQSNPAWVMSPDYVNWTGIQIGGIDRPSNNNLTLNNTGNVNISVAASNPLKVNATFLNGTTITTEGIVGDNFRAAGPEFNPCTSGNILTKSQLVTIPSFILDHESSTETIPSRKNLTFCLNTVSGISAQTYETLPGQMWTIQNG